MMDEDWYAEEYKSVRKKFSKMHEHTIPNPYRNDLVNYYQDKLHKLSCKMNQARQRKSQIRYE